MYGFKRTKQRLKKNRYLSFKSETWLVPRLDKRVQILEPSQGEAEAGGFIQDYSTLKTIWMGVESVSHNAYRRFSSIEGFGNVSHTFICRRNAVDTLGVAFDSAFSTEMDSIADLNPLKSTFYLGMEQGNTIKRRIFKILRAMDVNEKREYLSFLCEEIEEQGTGFQGVDY